MYDRGYLSEHVRKNVPAVHSLIISYVRNTHTVPREVYETIYDSTLTRRISAFSTTTIYVMVTARTEISGVLL